MPERPCPICQRMAEINDSPYGDGDDLVSCNVCGIFLIDESVAVNHLAADRSVPRHLIQGKIREFNRTSGDRAFELPGFNPFFEFLENLAEPDISTKLDLCLKYCAETSDVPGDEIRLNPDTEYPVAFARNGTEFKFYLDTLSEQGLLSLGGDLAALAVCVTHSGWLKYSQIQETIRDPKQVFLAFRFMPEIAEIIVNDVCAAIREVDFSPSHVYENREVEQTIDVKIVNEIRKSALVIADVTHASNGVYYEAGLGKGFGIPVVFSVRRDRLEDDAHFDTRQFQHITWQNADDFVQQVKDWIEAILVKNLTRPY